MPVSRVVDDQIVFGLPLTTAQLLDTALTRFRTALAHPSILPGDPIHSLASVGLARALVDHDSIAEAAAVVVKEAVHQLRHRRIPSNG